MKTVICIFIVLLCLSVIQNRVLEQDDTSLRYKRACTTQVTLATCNNSMENYRLRYYYYIEKVTVELCSKEAAEIFKWGITNTATSKTQYFDQYNYKHTLPIAESSLDEGKHILFMEIKEKGLSQVRDACTLNVEDAPVLLSFTIGHVIPGKPFYCDPTITDGKDFPLKMKWSIKCEPADASCPCDYEKKTLQPELGKASVHQRFDLEACTTAIDISIDVHKVSRPDKVYTYKHRVVVQKDVTMDTSLMLLESGPRQGYLAVDHTRRAILGLKCSVNCREFLASMPPTWKIKTADGVSLTSGFEVHAENKQKMIIKQGILKASTKYIVSAEGTTKSKDHYFETLEFTTTHNLVWPECTINPLEGISLKTVFVVTCTVSDPYFKQFPPKYQVVENPGKDETVLCETGHTYFETVLRGKGSEANIVVRGCNKLYKNTAAALPKVRITREEMSKNLSNNILEQIKYQNGVGNYDRSIMLATHLLAEIGESSMSEADKKSALKDFIGVAKEFNAQSSHHYTLITALIPPLIKLVGEDKKMKHEMSEFCSNFAKMDTNKILYNRHKQQEGKNMRKYSDEMSKCVAFAIPAMLTTTESPTGGDNTTIKIAEGYQFVTEEIPNYDFNIPGGEDERGRLATDVDDTVINLGNTYLKTMEPEDDILYLPKNQSQIEATGFGMGLLKDNAENLAARPVTINNVTVRTPASFANKHGEDVVALRVISYKPDFLGPREAQISTNIVDIGFQKYDESGVHPLDAPLDIEFTMLQIDDEYLVYDIPHLTNIRYTDPSMDYMINIHRLHLKRGQKCSAKFVLDPTIKLTIMFTTNRRPTIQDFKNRGLIIDKTYMDTNKVLRCPYQQDFKQDRFIYMAIIAKGGEKNNSKASYNVTFHYQRCAVYNRRTFKWDVANCIVDINYANDTAATIKCLCDHSSLHAAENYKIANKLDKIRTTLYTLQRFVNFTILIVVAIIFLTYCIILCFYQMRESYRMSKDRLIFVTDNLKNDRYAYMLVIKTLNAVFAGTTSNVCIQIFGEKLNSVPHILNYPDPDKMILQRNKIDWFILCTTMHLGKLQYIDIWLDNIGHRPSWYCEDIMIIDLQTKEESYFYVNADISVSTQKDVFVRKYPTRKQYKFGIIEIISKRFNFHLGAENTWNIFSRSQDKKFLFHQRVTVLLSMVYTNYVFIILLIGTPGLRMYDAFGKGDFYLHFSGLINGIVASIFCYIINYPIVFMFRHSAKAQKAHTLVIEAAVFPARFTNIAWSLLISWIVICMLYLIIFGVAVPVYSGFVVIFTGFVSILFSIFIMENLALAIAVVILERFERFRRTKYNYPYLFQAVEKQRRILFRTFGEFLMRPYFKKHYQKLSWADICEIKVREIERTNNSYLFREMIFFLIYLLISYIVIIMKGDKLLVICNKGMVQTILGNFNKSHMKLEDVNTIDHIYDYIQYTVIPMTHGYRWYGRVYVPDPGIMEDFNTKIIGIVQIRQQLRLQNCKKDTRLKDYQIPCTQNISEILKTSKYYRGSEISTSMGQLEVYGGHGYIVHLGRSYYNALYVFSLMKKHRWFCAQTKVVFVEFWTYNTNANYFNSVRIVIEVSPTGKIQQTLSVYTVRLLIRNPFLEIIGNAAWIYYYMLMVVLCLMQVSVNIQRYRRKYFLVLWNYMDIILVVTNFAMIILFSMIFFKLEQLFEELEESQSTDFINYFEVIRLSRITDNMLALITCVATAKLWKFLRFGTVFQVLEVTLKTTVFSFIGAFIYQGFIFVIFALYFRLMFGHMIDNFFSMTRAVIGIYTNSINSGRKFDKPRYFRQLHIGFFIWSLFMVSSKVFYSLYCTILMLGFNRCKTEFSNRKKTSSIQSYVRDEVLYNVELWKRKQASSRLAGGHDLQMHQEHVSVTYKFVRPKADNQRYADCVSMPKTKMNLMRLIGVCIIRHMDRQNNPDIKIEINEDTFRLLAQITVALKLSRKKGPKLLGDHDLFFQARDFDNSIRYVPNSTLLQMEYYVESMLQHKSRAITNVNQIHVEGDGERLGHFQEILQNITDLVSNIKIVTGKM